MCSFYSLHNTYNNEKNKYFKIWKDNYLVYFIFGLFWFYCKEYNINYSNLNKYNKGNGMQKVGLFFGSDTGNTEEISKIIQDKIGSDIVDVKDIANSTKEDFENYDLFLFGIPTWYYGENQCDWDDFFPELETIDFNGKKVGIFGCGDQEDYAEYFCDAMGAIAEILTNNGASLIGKTSSEGYEFEESKALLEDNQLVGLCIDEDRQPEMTEERVVNWVKQIKTEMNL